MNLDGTKTLFLTMVKVMFTLEKEIRLVKNGLFIDLFLIKILDVFEFVCYARVHAPF